MQVKVCFLTTIEVYCIGVFEVRLMSQILLLISGILYIVNSGLSVTKLVDLKVRWALCFILFIVDFQQTKFPCGVELL